MLPGPISDSRRLRSLRGIFVLALGDDTSGQQNRDRSRIACWI